MGGRCTTAHSRAAGRDSSQSWRHRDTCPGSARQTGANSRSSRNRNSSSAAGPSRENRASILARCCSACTRTALFKPLAIEKNPFSRRPPSNEKPHWVQPKLVAQVRFTEWTADNILRHPVYLGLRDDKRAKDVRREQTTEVPGSRFRVQGSGSG